MNKTQKSTFYDLNSAKAECIPVTELPDEGAVLFMSNCYGDFYISGCEDWSSGYCTWATPC